MATHQIPDSELDNLLGCASDIDKARSEIEAAGGPAKAIAELKRKADRIYEIVSDVRQGKYA